MAAQGPSLWQINDTAMSDLTEKIFSDHGQTGETGWMEGWPLGNAQPLRHRRSKAQPMPASVRNRLGWPDHDMFRAGCDGGSQTWEG
ncbi:hypothetical protein KGD83_11875 [Nocardiopsis akebiae]|uniref:Uncharacterized protein n=1 Tax=Nocardiopsis akebiae TaxID=2831968 RepID=A0ABX8CB85_9ACTN|nr:hypothetical protein [Nocardiopsis akebiae]QUX31120.1 hypothetical protein KGD83_11875 [Nocardiopsis akebiae]